MLFTCYKETRWLGMHKQAGTRAGNQRHTHNKRQPTNTGQKRYTSHKRQSSMLCTEVHYHGSLYAVQTPAQCYGPCTCTDAPPDYTLCSMLEFMRAYASVSGQPALYNTRDTIE